MPFESNSFDGVLTTQALDFTVQYTHTNIDEPQRIVRLLGKIGKLASFFPSQVPLDIDLGCAIFDNHKNLLDLVYFAKVRDQSHAVRHHGDALVGAKTRTQANNHQERISVRIDKTPRVASHLVFFAHEFHKAPIQAQGFFALNGAQIALDFDTHAALLWHSYKNGDNWHLSAPSLPLDGDNLQDCIQGIYPHIARDDIKLAPKYQNFGHGSAWRRFWARA